MAVSYAVYHESKGLVSKHATKAAARRKYISLNKKYPGDDYSPYSYGYYIKPDSEKNPGKLRNGEWFGIKAIRKIGNQLQILKNPGPLKKIKVKVVDKRKQRSKWRGAPPPIYRWK